MKTRLLILSALALLFHATSLASDFSAENEGVTIYYNIKSSTDLTVEVTGGSYVGDVVIPATVTYNGYTYSVTSIEKSAFYECTGLTSVIIGDNVTTIGDEAFAACTGLTSVTLGESVTTIGNNAFGSCISLTSVTLGESVTTIGNNAFGQCTRLTSITIPASVTSIDVTAFDGCFSLQEFVVEEGNMYYSTDDYGVLYNIDKTTIVLFPEGSSVKTYTIPETVTTIGASAFYLSNLNSVTIGSNVTTIEEHAFYSSYLTEITIPDNVTSIGEYAFGYCQELTTITIGSGVTNIGSFAFLSCTSLTTITIGSSVTSLGNYVFQICTNLSTITILCETPPTCGTNIFYGVNTTSNITLYVPKGTYDTYSSTSPWSDFTNIVESAAVEDKIEVDGIYYNVLSSSEVEVTSGDSKYTGSITIPETINYKGITYDVIGVGYQAFHQCTELTSIVIGDNVTYIDNNAFDTCSGLTSIVIGENVTSIGTYAFYGCSSLTEVTIPDEVKSIGAYAFQFCSNLASVTLGENVATIGKEVFYNCAALTSITSLNPEPPTCQSTTFSGMPTSTCTLYVPVGSKEAYSSATGWSDFENIVQIDENGDVYDPSVQTIEATDVTYDSATLNGILMAGTGSITEKGFEYWTAEDESDKKTAVDTSDAEEFSATITELAEATTYNYRAYATTEYGTTYGEAITFTTLNATLLKSITTAIEDVQTELEEVWETIQTNYPDVADTFEETYTDLASQLEALLDSAEEAYEAGTLNGETETAVTESLATISASIADLLADAKTAENAYLYGIISDKIEAVHAELTTVWETIETKCADVAESFNTDYEAIVTDLTTLKQDMESAYEGEELTQETVEEVEAELATISASIAELSANAKTAENAYLYGIISEKISAVETELTTTWSAIETECADVAESFKTDYEAIVTDLTTLKQDTESAYEGEELTQEAVEEVEETLASIEEKIEKLTTDAVAAEENYQLYTATVAKIGAVKTELEEAWETIAEECSDVADTFEETYNDLASQLATLLTSTEATYEAGLLTEEKVEEVEAELATISSSIAELSANAKTAENAYLYGIITEKIEAVETELTTAWETIETECADVADTFEETYNDLASQLATLLTSTEATYEAGLLTEEKVEEVEAELATISSSIAELSANAKTAENAYLYGIITEKIEAVETELTTAWETIETECADVADNFKTDYEAIVTDLTTLKQDTESAYEDEELTQETEEEVKETLATISASIADLLADAKTAENAYLYNTLYEDAVSKVEATEESLATAWTTIQTQYPDMEEELQETHDNIAAEIEAVRTELDEAYEAGELTEDAVAEMEEELAAIEKEIADMLSKASIATGIESARSDYGDDVRIYNLAGSRVHNIERGNIYIYRYSDGTVKKVLVK